MKQIRWGILSTGNIARQFCEGVQGGSRGVLAAVGSRSIGAAAAFAEQHGIPAAHGTYDELIADPAVDAVYVATPNALHAEWAIKALQAGKHVLCEKPMAVSAEEADRMFAAAREADRLLVEAFMYRCHPQFTRVCDLLNEGVIGEIRTIHANFCYRMRHPEGNIRFDTALHGGALMDIGCYCVDCIREIVEHHTDEGVEPNPVHLSAMARTHATGVDENAVFAMQFGSGVLATGCVGMGVQMNNALRIGGTEGHLSVDVPWKPPTTGAVIRVNRQTPPKMEGGGAAPAEEVITIDADAPLFGLEAGAFAAAALDGVEPFITPAETLANHRLMDRLRAMIRAGAVV